MDTKVSLGTSGLMTLTGGTPDANGVRNYTVDVDPTKVAKTDYPILITMVKLSFVKRLKRP